ncbi:ubiquitin and ribosomal protein S27a [Coprinopsis cinerea AmutBmut pab1-1]|nr:ubiquitin and ribosomal protein S27a [Coprinopsis cinerea AmutBmut pab1-1]
MQYPCTAGCNAVFEKKAAQISHSKSCGKRRALKEDQEQWAQRTASLPDAAPAHAVVDPPKNPWENLSPRPSQTRKTSTSRQPKHNLRVNAEAGSSRRASSPRGVRGQTQRTMDPPSDIRIEHHAKRKRPPEHITIDQYNLRRRRPGASADIRVPLPSLTSKSPYFPFQTDADYRFAKLIFRSAMRDDDVKELLSLINKCVDKKDTLTFDGSQAIHDAWKDASCLVTPFECNTIDVPYKEEPHKYDVWVRSVWKWALELVENPKLAPEFVWESAKMFKKNDDAMWERFVTEPWTGDDWAKIEDNLPDDGVPLCLIVYADKTQLSSFGGKKAYPVYAKIANLPAHIRNGKGIGGGCVVGWLPIIPEKDKKSNRSTEWVEYKRVVWHNSFREILESIRTHSKDGIYYKCGDGVVRRLFPCILMLSADYEEQAVMAGIRGSKTKQCPVCLVDEDNLATFFTNWEYRDAETTQKLVEVLERPDAPERVKGTARKKLQELNVRPIKNAFADIANSDPHRALSFDRLHNYPGGLAKTHLLPMLYEIFDRGPYSMPEVQKRINTRASAVPRWPGLTHYDNITTKKAFQDSNKWEDLARLFPFILYDDVIDKSDKPTLQILRCLRVFLNLNTFSSFEVHTESTVKEIEKELQVFCEEIKKLGDLFEGKSWLFPKMHLQMHLPHDIYAKGATRNYTTKTFETMHRALKFYYQYMTNFKDADKQILNADQRGHVIDFIVSIIDVHLEALKDTDDSTDEELQYRFSFGNITLKAPQGPRKARPLDQFYFDCQEELGGHAHFFEGVDLSQMLSEFCSLNGLDITIRNSTLVRSFRSMEVVYTSKESWDIERDLLRCSPSFHGRPRYDSVILQTTTGNIFARLLALFTLQAPGTPDTDAIPIALALPYTAPIPKNLSTKDAAAGFYRVRRTVQAGAELFFARSIIRGAVLIPVNEQETDYLVFDVADSDMFLRVRELLRMLI